MKKFLNVTALGAVALVSTVSVASATCLTGDCSTTPPASSGGLQLTGNVASASQGLGVAEAPTDGFGITESQGSSGLTLVLDGSGKLCQQPSCATVDGGLAGFFTEEVQSAAGGLSEKSGVPVATLNQTGSAGMISGEFPNGFSIQLGGTAAGAGMSNGIAYGDQAYVLGETAGDSVLFGGLNVDGVCPDCYSGNWEAGALVNQSAVNQAGAISGPGTPAQIQTQTGLSAAATLDAILGN